jgi:hypothetical protein
VRQCANALSFPDIVRVFGEDLARRGVDLRVMPDRLEDLAFAGTLAAHYPEARPQDALPSIFDA